MSVKRTSGSGMAARLATCAGHVMPSAFLARGIAAAAIGLAGGILSPAAAQGPQGSQVVRGNVSIQRSGASTLISASNNAIINHHSFNIRAGESVHFVQPGAGSRVLNRITGPDPSMIAGTLTSNGIVYISNPAGVYFTQGSLVNVGGIYAAAANITDSNFLNNINKFTGAAGRVENHGTIRTGDGGAVHLIGAQVANFGSIAAPDGIVTMSAGREVYIGEANGNFFAKVSGGGAGEEAGVTNGGTISAGRGRVAFGAGDMYAMAIDHRGRTTARDITLEGGRRGVVSVSGALDASDTSAGQRGGSVKVLGEKVGIFGAEIDASGAAGGGTILVGGNQLGQGPERNAEATYVSPDARLRADAIDAGDGGRVIVWSDQVSRIYGEISARGGEHGGHGGFVETSSKIELEVDRVPDVGAARGRSGEWLIDPRNVDIVAGGGNVNINTSSPFEPTGTDAQLGVDLIITALTGGMTVSVNTTAAAGGQDGNIRLLTALDYDGTGAGTLNLIAAGDITLSGSIFDSSPGDGDLLNLGLTAGGGRDIFINSLISLNGGSLTASGRDLSLSAAGSVATGGGNFGMTMTGTVTLESDIDAGAGSLSINRPVLLTGDVTLTGASVSLGSTVNSSGGARDLTIATGAGGAITFGGAIGNTGALDVLTTDADATVQLGVVSVAAADVQFDGPVVLTANTTLAAPLVSFGSTVNSDGTARNLTVNTSGGGVTTFAGALGGISSLGTLSTNADGSTVVGGTIAAASISFANPTALNGGTLTASGLATFSSAVTLGANTVINVSDVAFTSTLNSDGIARNLTVNTSGNGSTIFSGAVGGVSPLGAIVTNADGTTGIGAAVTASSINFNDVVTLSGGTVTTTGSQSYNGAVLLGANTTLNGQNLTLGSTVNSTGGVRNLTLNTSGGGVTTLGGIVGGVDALGALSTNADGTTLIGAAVNAASLAMANPVTLSGSVTTTGNQTFSAAVQLGSNVTLAGQNILFSSTINSSGGARNLTVNTSGGGVTTFSGAVGGSSPLGTLTTNADGTTVVSSTFSAASASFNDAVLLSGGSITTSGFLTFSGAVTLGANTLISASDVAFASTVNSDGSARNLTVNTSSNGSTLFGGAVGGTSALAALTTNADGSTSIGGAVTAASIVLNNSATLSGGNISTTGDQNYNGAVVLGANTTLSGANITLASTVNSSGSARNLTLNTVGGGTTTLAGTVGGNSALGAISTNADGSTAITGAITAGSVVFADPAVLSGGSITTSGNQTYSQAVLLGAGTTLAGQNVTFSSTVDSSGAARNLTINTSGGGTTMFSGAVGGIGPLGALTTNADGSTLASSTINAAAVSFGNALALNGGSVTTSGDQSYAAVLLGADTVFSGRHVTFNSTLNSSGAARNVTVDSSSNGITTFAGAVGGVLALDTLTTNADGSTVIGSSLSAATIVLNDSASLAGIITTTGDQTYVAPVTLGGNTTLTANNISFNSTVNSDGTARNLIVNSTGGGQTTFSGAVGNVSALGALSTNADGATVLLGPVTAASATFSDPLNLAGGAITTSGQQTYGSAVLLSADTTVTGQNVTFNSTVDSSGAARNLTVITPGGTATFAGAVGGGSALADLLAQGTSAVFGGTVSAASLETSGNASVNGGSITTTTDQTFGGNVTLGAATALQGRNITFGGLLNSSGSARDLAITTSGGGTATFGGAVGGILSLGAVSRNADGATTIGTSFSAQSLSVGGAATLGGGAIATTGAQTYSGVVLLGGDVAISGQNVTLASAVNSAGSPRDLTVTTAGGGSAIFGGPIGNTLALRDLQVLGGPATVASDIRARSTLFGSALTFNGNSITTDFDQTYSAGVLLSQHTTLAGRNISFGSTVNSAAAARDLFVNSSGGGTTTFSGVVGGINPLRGIVTNADGATVISAPLTANSLVMHDTATLGGNTLTTAATQVFNGAVMLSANTTLSASAITFNGSIDSASGRNLILNTTGGGVKRLLGPVGQIAPLGAIVFNADGTSVIGGPVAAGSVAVNSPLTLSGQQVATSGMQQYNAPVTLTAGALLSGSEVRFESTLNSGGAARNLEVNTGAGGLVRFADDVGTGLALGDLVVGAGGSAVIGGELHAASVRMNRATTINGGNITTSGQQWFDGAVVLGADATLTAGSLNFAGTVDSSGSARSLTLDVAGGGVARLGGSVGAGLALADLVTQGAGMTVVDAPVIHAGSIHFQNAARLDQDLELNVSTMARFGGSLNSEAGSRRGLTVSTGDVRFDGAVGAQADGELGDVVALGALSQFGTFSAASLMVGGEALLAGSQLQTSGDQTYAGAVRLGADVTLHGRHVEFAGTVDSNVNPMSLSVVTHGGGDVTFGGIVGGSVALQALAAQADGRVLLAGAQVNTAGQQSYAGPVVLLESTALSASGMHFSSTVDSGPASRHLGILLSGGDLVFGGPVGAASPLSSLQIGPDGRTQIQGGTVITAGAQVYGNEVHLHQDSIFAGNAITFASSVDAAPASRAAMRIETTGGGTATFEGAVGAGPGGALGNFSTSADGVTRLGNVIQVEDGNIIFDNAVVVFGHAALTTTGGDGIYFNSTIDGEGPSNSLTLVTDVNANATAASPRIPVISFRGHVGAGEALGSLMLGGDRPRGAIPTVATIVAGVNPDGTPISGDYTLSLTTSGSLITGEYQKWTVVGNLVINAGGLVMVGDVSTRGDFRITAPEIAIRTRPGSAVLGAVPGSLELVEDPERDSGVDIVSGGEIVFSVAPRTERTSGEGELRPTFATQEATGISDTLQGFAQRAFGPRLVDVIHAGDIYMDLRSAGPTNTNVAEAIAGAAPRESQSGQVSQDTGVGRAQREELTQLGVYAKTLEQRELAEFMIGRALYNDVPETPEPVASDYQVTVYRLPSEIVARVLESYREVFWAEIVDPETGERRREPQPRRVAEAISAAWNAYVELAGDEATVQGFREMLAAASPPPEAARQLERLRVLFERLDHLGLTPIELRIARGTLLRAIAVPGLTTNELESAILTGPRTIDQ